MSAKCTYTLDPDDHEETSLTDTWRCPHEAVDGTSTCRFHMDAAQREAAGISEQAVVEEFTRLLGQGDPEQRQFIGATLPELSLSYIRIESTSQYPVDLRHATISGGFVATNTWFEEQLDLRHSHLGGLALKDCRFEYGLLCAGATVAGETNLFETVTTGDDADFTGVTFAGPVCADEAEFRRDTSFADATFREPATFLGATFYGRSNEIDDNTTFTGAVFEDAARFEHATFEATTLEDVTFAGDVSFRGAVVTGGCLFTGGRFEAVAEFDETEFRDDTSFAGVTFAGTATFAGAEFEGGVAVLDDDVSFEGATFESRAVFRQGTFGYTNFTDTSFEGTATFQRATFDSDALFEGAVFGGPTDFDEVLFDGDANFTGAQFQERAVFRGCQFRGGTDHLADDARFERAVFGDDAEFQNADFTSANFLDAAFEGSVDFTEAAFTDSLRLRASSFGENTYFDFTEASIVDGSITQPESGWIRFDMTRAALGALQLRSADPDGERELLDYFRICDTDFEEFEFANNLEYLDRNDWVLHTFDAGNTDREYAVEMTPQVIERTYLKAKNSASAQGSIKAAGEFRVKRQQFARRKFLRIARDSAETVSTRFQNLLRATENMFLGLSCGYGLRLYRIAGVFVIFPLFAGLLFAFGGDPFATDSTGQLSSLRELTTSDGLETLGVNIYFSYISFLTIGYGNIGPEGAGARFTAGALVYMNVILAGLFLYALIKRSEV